VQAVPLAVCVLFGACRYDDWELPQGGPVGASGQASRKDSNGSDDVAGGGFRSFDADGAGGPPASGGAGRPPASNEEPDGAAGGSRPNEAGGNGAEGGGVAQGGTGPEPECDLSAPFLEPRALRFATNRDRTDGRLSPDELTVFYHAYQGIWMATRTDRDAPFENDHSLIEDPSLSMMSPSVTADGTRLYYLVQQGTEDEPPGWYVSPHRNEPVAPFAFGTRLPNSKAEDGSLFVSPSGEHAYFVRDWQLWMATRLEDDFSDPEPLTSLWATGLYHLLPLVSADEKLIYFSVSEGGADYDIYRAFWNDETGEFENREMVSELQSPAAEFPDWLSPDGCRLYIHRYDKVWNYPQLMVASKPALGAK